MSEPNRPRILVICDYYLPGFKSGGGMRTIVNMVERVSDRYQFFVLTRDHDGKGDLEPYPTIQYGVWSKVGSAMVSYMRRGETGFRDISAAIGEVCPDCIYLNSVFSSLTFRTLLYRKLGKSFGIPLIVAPEGELAPGALAIKALKKKLYLATARLLGLFHGVLWKVTNEGEATEVAAQFRAPRTQIAPNVSARSEPSRIPPRRSKERGSLRLVYLSRITPKKNLLWFIRVLKNSGDQISLDVFGDSDDEGYLQSCVIEAEGLRVAFKGPLAHERVVETLAEYDLFVLPTLNENYGHVVLEALSAGTPLLISDTTPWTDAVNSGAGRALPLDHGIWAAALDVLKALDATGYAPLTIKAMDLARTVSGSGDDVNKTVAVLDAAVARRR